MEKKEAIREWCLEMAIGLCQDKYTVKFMTKERDTYSVGEVIEVARKLEEYIAEK